MTNLKNKVLAGVGLLLAGLTIFEGTSVLLGKSNPDQIILKWLVAYNVVVAFFSLYVVFAIWTNLLRGKKFSLIVVILHFLVLLLLLGIYFTSGEVAIKSILAMVMRVTVWSMISFFYKPNQS